MRAKYTAVRLMDVAAERFEELAASLQREIGTGRPDFAKLHQTEDPFFGSFGEPDLHS